MDGKELYELLDTVYDALQWSPNSDGARQEFVELVRELASITPTQIHRVAVVNRWLRVKHGV